MQRDFLSWVQFGDLHIRDAHDENYLDFGLLVEEANRHLQSEVDFAFLPGDNADDGTEDQYRLVRSALDRLRLPAYVITGDHDRKGGSLQLFQRFLEPRLYRSIDLQGFRLLFLNAMDASDAKAFDFSSPQLAWTTERMLEAQAAGLRILVFVHLYPSELVSQGEAFRDLIRRFDVELVSMGHTHYNEVANDGRTIYSATRSTGQIEEGPPGFSITCIDEDVVSWKFKQRGVWPFVMITSPADERLITRPRSPQHVVRGSVVIRAKAWGLQQKATMTCSINDAPAKEMQWAEGHWQLSWDSREVNDGTHRITVRSAGDEAEATDEISIVVNQSGDYTAPVRSVVDYENAIPAYPAKGIFGTQLGPNENGTKGPWPSWR